MGGGGGGAGGGGGGGGGVWVGDAPVAVRVSEPAPSRTSTTEVAAPAVNSIVTSDASRFNVVPSVEPISSEGEALVADGVDRADVLYVGGTRLEAAVYPDAGFPFVSVELMGLQRRFTAQNLKLPFVVKRAVDRISEEFEVRGVGVALGWRFGLPYARLRIAGFLDNGSAPGGVDAPPDAWFEVLEPGSEIQVRLERPGRPHPDDGFHPVIADQFGIVDHGRGNPHPATLYRYLFALVGPRKPEHAAHFVIAPDFFQKGLRDPFGPEGVSRHHDEICDIPGVGPNVQTHRFDFFSARRMASPEEVPIRVAPASRYFMAVS